MVALEVKDNYGVEYDKDRPATASYRTEHLLTLTALPTPILITDISPSIGSSRAFIYLSGDGASPYGEVELYFNEVYITTISANTWGEWSATFMVPVVSSGQYTVQVIDVASDTADAIIFTVLQGPTLRVYPGEAAIGSKISIFGENFQQFTGLYLSFEDLMFFSIITVGEDGTFNATFIVPAVNSGDYVIKVLGMSYYPGGSQIYPEASITVTKGLDTLFNEIEDLENALNELRDECNYNYNYSNYNYNYNYNSNCNHSSTEAPSLNEPTLEGETNVAQSSASLSEMDDLQNDGQVEILDSIENMIFEAKIIAITTILIVVATCILTAIVLSKRK